LDSLQGDKTFPNGAHNALQVITLMKHPNISMPSSLLVRFCLRTRMQPIGHLSSLHHQGYEVLELVYVIDPSQALQGIIHLLIPACLVYGE